MLRFFLFCIQTEWSEIIFVNRQLINTESLFRKKRNVAYWNADWMDEGIAVQSFSCDCPG